MQIIELLNQYRSLVTYVMKAFGCANINKSIRNNIIEIIFLFMVIPGRINFLQIGRFGRRSEQCYRQTFWRGAWTGWISTSTSAPAPSSRPGAATASALPPPHPTSPSPARRPRMWAGSGRDAQGRRRLSPGHGALISPVRSCSCITAGVGAQSCNLYPR